MTHRVGAIPFDIREDRMAILFVTSQRRGRWILPKGLIKPKESYKQCCKREAFEEAGIRGKFLGTTQSPPELRPMVRPSVIMP